MDRAEYWQKRFSELKERQLNKADDYYMKLEKEYRQAIYSMNRDIVYWYNRLSKNNDVSLAGARRLLKGAELDEFKWSVEEYIKRGREFGLDGKWAKQLENASARIHISRYDSLKIQMQQHLEELTVKKLNGVSDIMGDVYEDTFYRSAFEIQKGLNIGSRLDRIDPREIKRVLDTPWAADGRNFSDRIWGDKKKLIKTLDRELKQGLIRGDSVDKISNKIAKEMNVSRKQAKTLVRTEAAYFGSKAQEKAYNELDVEKYQIDATLDIKTSEICREMDQKVFDMKDYEIGVTAPLFHVRCRTGTAPYFDDEFAESDVRASRAEEGDVRYISGNMDYNKWYIKYVA